MLCKLLFLFISILKIYCLSTVVKIMQVSIIVCVVSTIQRFTYSYRFTSCRCLCSNECASFYPFLCHMNYANLFFYLHRKNYTLLIIILTQSAVYYVKIVQIFVIVRTITSIQVFIC